MVLRIFFAAFFINLLYEILHSVLYETCLAAPLPKYVRLILKAALFDGFWIAAFHFIFFVGAENGRDIFSEWRLTPFLLGLLIFGYLWEIWSVKNDRWKYSSKMPLVFGIGLTPFIQLPLTGILSLLFVFHFW